MGCNCSKQKNVNTRWVYSFNGQSRTYRSEIEAKAAKVRNKGQGNITVVNG